MLLRLSRNGEVCALGAGTPWPAEMLRAAATLTSSMSPRTAVTCASTVCVEGLNESTSSIALCTRAGAVMTPQARKRRPGQRSTASNETPKAHWGLAKLCSSHSRPTQRVK